MKNKSLSLFISIAGILVLGLHIVSYQFNLMGEQVLMPLRIITILLFMYYAIMQKKLPTWILVSMLIGIEVGYDFPHIAIHLDVLSKVFLKLIKTIIAPLIFATLVVGIAGHSNLKQVGRIAWKSIVYFYFATTLALFIGLAAINFTKAGAGITMPTDTKELPKVEQQAVAYDADHAIAKFCRLTAEYMRMKEKINSLFNDNK